jgi:uncharacterized membrane protein
MAIHTLLQRALTISLLSILIAAFSVAFLSAKPADAASTLILDTPVLVFSNPNAVSFTISAATTDVYWTVKGAAGQIIDEGITSPVDSTATIQLGAPMATGYYTLTFSSTGNDPTTAAFGVTGPKPSKNDFYSVQTLSAHTGSFWRADVNRITPMLSNLGFSARRDSAYWQEFEQTQNTFVTTPQIQTVLDADQQNDMSLFWTAGRANSLYDNGLVVSTPEGILAYAKYIDAFLTQHPAIKKTELLNEFNGNSDSACGASGTCYAAIAKGVYEYVKPRHPDVQIIAGAVAGFDRDWWEEYFAAGGVDYADAFSFHPYNVATYRYNELANSLTTMIKAENNNVGKPIYLSEVGWSITDATTGNAAKVSTEKQQADRMIYAFVAPQASPEIAGVNWYNAINYGSPPTEYNFGLFHRPTVNVRGYQPKQSAIAFYNLRTRLDGFAFSRTEMITPTVRAYVFTNSSGDVQRVLWRTDTFWSGDEDEVQVSVPTDSMRYTTAYNSLGDAVQTFDNGTASFLQDLSNSPVFVISSNTPPAAQPGQEIPDSGEAPGVIPGVPNTGILGFLNRPQPLLLIVLGIASAVVVYRVRSRRSTAKQ